MEGGGGLGSGFLVKGGLVKERRNELRDELRD